MKYVSSYRLEAVNIITKHRVVENVQQIPNVVEATDYLGQSVSVRMAGVSIQDVEQITGRIVNQFELTKIILGTDVVREVLFQPDKLDWQIFQKLRYDALCSIKDLAHDLSITPRMAEYRISKLLNSGALLIRAVIDTQKQSGLIFYELEMLVEEPKQFGVVKKLGEIYGEKLWSVHTSAGGVLRANLFGFTLAEPEDATVRALELEGVGACTLLIFKEVIESRRPNWMDDLLEQKVTTKRS
jgi:DNA-binding Lrp family transcriptional regulator